MKRKLIVTYEIIVTDLPRAQLKAEAASEGCRVSELPGVCELSALDLVYSIACIIPDNPEIWAGGGIFAKIKSVQPIKYGFENEGAA